MMAIRKTIEELRAALEYDPCAGLFFWKSNRLPNIKAGDLAGHMNAAGYWSICLDGDQMLAHRLAIMFTTGAEPSLHVDHIDGNPMNNAISNLREVTRSVNGQNMKRARSDNKSSGLLGVSWSTPKGKWQANIRTNGVLKFIGYFDDKHVAHEAYLQRKRLVHAGCTI